MIYNFEFLSKYKHTSDLLQDLIEFFPIMEKDLLNYLDIAFTPRIIIRQLVIILIFQIGLVSINSLCSLTKDFHLFPTEKQRKDTRLISKLNKASSYGEWQSLALKLDKIRGKNIWCENDESPYYDYKRLKSRINDICEMILSGDIYHLMFRIRGGLSRCQFGVQNPSLFSKALGGTKYLIENYHNILCSALNFICDSNIDEDLITMEAKLAFFNESRHSYGRTALLLSGGGYLGYYHVGVAKALWNQGLLPRVISGASAGSIIAAMLGTCTEEEYEMLLNSKKLLDGVRIDFFKVSRNLKSRFAQSINSMIPNFLHQYSCPILSYLFDGKFLNLDTEHFKKLLRQDIGDYTFQEAFDRTGRIINITVAPMNSYDPPRLLNYLTAPHVCVWSAAAASSALPGVFDPIGLVVKESNGKYRPESDWSSQVDHDPNIHPKHVFYTDGSVENDLPMQQLAEQFNINHFIVSQVNPHSALLMSLSHISFENPVLNSLLNYTKYLVNQCRDYFNNLISFLLFLTKSPTWSLRRGLTQTILQEYEGRSIDITLTPWVGHISSFSAAMSALKNATEEDYSEMIEGADANTWPYISRIKSQCQVEMTLEKCIQRLRKRIFDEGNDIDSTTKEELFSEVNASAAFHKAYSSSNYTKKQIVNLSGLSISDPLPQPLKKYHYPDSSDHLDTLAHPTLSWLHGHQSSDSLASMASSSIHGGKEHRQELLNPFLNHDVDYLSALSMMTDNHT